MAAGWGNTDTVNAMIAAGAKIDTRNSYGKTPLHYAAQWGNTGTLNTLIAAGAKVDARDRYGATHCDTQRSHRFFRSDQTACGCDWTRRTW